MRNLSCWGRKCNKWGKWAYENNKKKTMTVLMKI